MLNVKKCQVQMSDFIPNAVSILGKIMPLRHFTKKCMESRAPIFRRARVVQC